MSYDSCSCDYDQPEFCNITTRKARKPHTCSECRGPIEPGVTYEYVTGKWEDVLYFKTCPLCLELRQWALISVPCFCFAYEALHENVRDMVTEVRRDVPRGFVFEWGRRMIVIQRHRYGRHWPRRGIHEAENRRLAEFRAKEKKRRAAERRV